MTDETPQTLSSKEVFAGRVFHVRVDELRYADGSAHRCDVVEHAGSFAIVALTDRNEIVLVRQYRHPTRVMLWEIPAGTAEPGEDPREGALRELAEETGYRASRIRRIAGGYVTPGFCSEFVHLFLAQRLTEGKQSLDEDERVEVALVSLERALEMMEAGEIVDVKTLLALQWTALRRGELGSGTVDRKG